MLHVNLLRWCNLIGSLSWDIGQYPVIVISNSEYCCGRLVTLIKTNKSGKKCFLVYFSSVHLVVYTKTIIHLRLRE